MTIQGDIGHLCPKGSEMPINNETERMLSSRQEQLVLCPAVNDQPFGGIVYVNGGSSIYTMSSNVEKSPLWHYYI